MNSRKALYVFLQLLIVLTMAKPFGGLNVPPLAGRTHKRLSLAATYEDTDWKLINAALMSAKWELGDTEWSRNWGKMLRDLSDTTMKIRDCLGRKRDGMLG